MTVEKQMKDLRNLEFKIILIAATSRSYFRIPTSYFRILSSELWLPRFYITNNSVSIMKK